MRAGIALGSNIEPRDAHMELAIQHLRDLSEPPGEFLLSKIYETEPVDCPPGSAAFLNAAVEIEISLSLNKLLNQLQAIESELGRTKIRPKNAPRPIDLDLLYCDNITHRTKELILPHPRIAERRFVLEPLNDICPDRILPNQVKSVHLLLFDLINN